MSVRHALAIGLLATIWGATFLLIKVALRGFAPPIVVCGRLSVAALVLIIPLSLDRGLGSLRNAIADIRARPGLAVLLAVVGYALPFMLISVGELTVPSGLTAVLIAAEPISIALMARFFDQTERISRVHAVGLTIGIIGVALVVGVELVATFGEFLGGVAILGGAASYACAGFLVKNRYQGLTSTESTFLSVMIAALMTAPIAIASAPSKAPGLGPILAILTLGAVGTAFAFVLYYQLVPQIGVGRAALVTYIQPAVALIFGAIFLSEAITAVSIVGFGLILIGVFVATQREVTATSSQLS